MDTRREPARGQLVTVQIATLPEWTERFLADAGECIPAYRERMRLAIGLARHNVEQGTGGPFGAAVFDLDDQRLVAVGVNRVEAEHCSSAHAEIAALCNAQHILGNHDLGALGGKGFELVTSSEPCLMCLGAVHWSGVRRLVCGARREDAEAIGFDEGPVADDWTTGLETRSIRVRRDVLRAEARSVLRLYVKLGRTVYNPTSG